MKVRADRVCADVRVMLNLDEQPRSLLDVGDIETLSADRRIRALMPRAVADTELAADPRLLDSGYNFAEDDDFGVDPAADPRLLRITVRLPPDFMRLVSFRLAGWDRSISRAGAPDMPPASLMHLAGASALVAGHGPVAAIERHADGPRLTVWCQTPAGVTPEVTEAVYRPQPAWDRDGAIEVSRLLYDAAVAQCAGLFLTNIQPT